MSEGVILYILTMLTSVRISQPVNSLLDSVACTLFIYRWHWFLFDIFDAISVTEIIITIITISGSLKLFIRLNFACQGNPLFDVFIWNIESFMLHLKKTKEFELSVNPHIFASAFCVLIEKIGILAKESKNYLIYSSNSWDDGKKKVL